MKRFTKYIFIVCMLGLILSGCTKQEEAPVVDEASVENVAEELVIEGEKPVVTIELEEGKKIKVELYPSIAENTVNNFISLVTNDYYNGVIFHRVIDGFMIQGGDPDGIGTGGPGYSIKGEFSENGFENNLKHTRGVISMARSNAPDSAGSQFFIMHQDSDFLDGKYASFGKVIEGMEYVDEIALLKRDGRDKPLEDAVMIKVSVELNGYQPSEPVIIK